MTHVHADAYHYVYILMDLCNCSTGVIIDSCIVITRIAPMAYAALRAAFRKLMSKYPTAPAASILDTCYDLSKYDTVPIPKVGLEF